MRWLVTGGLGFIGYNLIQRIRYEHEVAVIDNMTSEVVKSIPGVKILKGDIRNFDLVNNVVEDVDVIIHLAANTGVQQSFDRPWDDCNINVMGTLNLLEAARNHGPERIKKFVFASSGAVLGPQMPPMRESQAPRPISPYGASKLAGEAYCSAYDALGVNSVALRFSNVYGPWSRGKTSVVAKMIKQAIVREEWLVNGDGAQTRDFIHVDDIVSAIIASVDSNACGVFQIATGLETSINGLMGKLQSKLRPYKLTNNIRYGSPLNGDVRRNFADISLAKKALNWRPTVALSDGLENTIEWFMRSKSGNSV